MGVVPVTINGIAYPKNKKDPPFPVTIVGSAWITGLSVDNKPPTGPGGQPPLGIWGPTDPRPTPPIALPPNQPPLVIWGPDDPRPTPPIAIPPDIPQLPNPPPTDENGFIKPPPADGGWALHGDYGWLYYPPPGGAGPKK